MNQEYPMWLHIKDIISEKHSLSIDLVVIGDSRAKAGFIPNKSKFNNSLNLSVGGGTPIEGYYTLKKFLKYNSGPKNLILSYGPFHLDSQDCYWHRTVKFDFLGNENYLEVENISKSINDMNTLGINTSFTDYINPAKYSNDLKNGLLEKRWIHNNDVYNFCVASKGHYYFGRAPKSDGLNTESQRINFTHSALLNEFFIKTIKLAKKHNIKIFYYTMPFNQASYEVMKKEYKLSYENYINKISHHYNITVCNKIDFLTNDNFGDSSHLYKGATITTNEIDKCVSEKK